jgi:hypothetical protein
MPIAVLRSLAGIWSGATARGRDSGRPRRNARRASPARCPAGAGTITGEALEDRCLFALAITPVPAATPGATLAGSLLVPNSGITVTGATYVGIDNQGGTFTGFDLTSATNQRVNIRDGLLLTNGLAASALGPNDSPATSTDLGTAGDPDLDTLVGTLTEDANSLTLNFTADIATRSVIFDFVFGSEEFNEFLNLTFNDAFAAYLDGTQVSFDINGRPITVNNNFFRVNNINGNMDIEYDGLTPRIRTTAPLNPTITNHTLKFVIADTGDGAVDSGVFLGRLQGSPTAVPAPTTELPTPGVLVLASNNFTVDENAGTGTVVVNRVNGTSGLVSVNYSVASGTAIDGQDFTGSIGTLLFADGQTSATITVPIIDDLLPEGDETAVLTLSNPDDAGLGTPNTGTLTILDNELAITFIPPNYLVSETSGNVTVTVSRSGAITAPATVDYATADRTGPDGATASADYIATSGTINFAVGQRTATVVVPVIDDFTDEETTETFDIALSNPTGADLGTQRVAGVGILNVDRPPSIYDITAFAPKGRIEALYLQANDTLQPGRAIDPATYGLFVHSESKFNNQRARQRIPFRGVEYNSELRIITLRPMRPLKNNIFYEVSVRGTGDNGVISSSNQPLDGDLDRITGENFVGYFGRGTRLNYFDRDGDKVKLGATGGGVIEVFRDVSRDARAVRYVGAGPGSAVFGRVLKGTRTSNGLTDIRTLVLGGAQSVLPNPPFRITYAI